MNQNRKEELLTRWLDDALSAEERRELEPLLAAHPELQGEREAYVKVRADLRAVIPGEVEPPYPDFFNTHLERRIAELAVGGDAQAERERAKEKGAGLGRMWTWWMGPAAAALVVAAFIAGMKSAPSPVEPVAGSDGWDVYSPLESITTEIVRDEVLGATLLVVEGLEELLDDDLVLGGGADNGSHGYFVTTEHVY